jgi:hypothetical protein
MFLEVATESLSKYKDLQEDEDPFIFYAIGRFRTFEGGCTSSIRT